MERKNIYFISDLHLGATYLKNPRSYEQRVVRWLESIRDDAAELYRLGAFSTIGMSTRLSCLAVT